MLHNYQTVIIGTANFFPLQSLSFFYLPLSCTDESKNGLIKGVLSVPSGFPKFINSPQHLPLNGTHFSGNSEHVSEQHWCLHPVRWDKFWVVNGVQWAKKGPPANGPQSSFGSARNALKRGCKSHAFDGFLLIKKTPRC